MKYIISDMHPRTNCWICKTTSQLEQHHIVPRANGGSNGPLCDLCSICHSSIHKLSYIQAFIDYPTTINNLNEFPDYSKSQSLKAHYLSSIILNSRKLTHNENKPVKSVSLLDAKTHGRLKILTKTMSMSQEKIIIYAINKLYIQLIGEIK